MTGETMEPEIVDRGARGFRTGIGAPNEYRIDYECRTARGEEAPLVDIRITARLLDRNHTLLGEVAWLQAWRYATGYFAFGEMDTEIGMVLDGISHEAHLPIEQIHAAEKSLVDFYDDDEFQAYIQPVGLIVVEHIGAHPAIRGTGIGLGLLRELRAMHAGISLAVALTACPIKSREEKWKRGVFASAQRRLIKHYRSDQALGFRAVAKHEPSLLTAFWAASDEAPTEKEIELDAVRLQALLPGLAAKRGERPA